MLRVAFGAGRSKQQREADAALREAAFEAERVRAVQQIRVEQHQTVGAIRDGGIGMFDALQQFAVMNEVRGCKSDADTYKQSIERSEEPNETKSELHTL